MYYSKYWKTKNEINFNIHIEKATKNVLTTKVYHFLGYLQLLWSFSNYDPTFL